MTDRYDLDALLGAYLVNGTNEVADRVIDAALDQIEHTPQRRPQWHPGRFPTMRSSFQIGAVAIVGVLALGGTLFLTRPTAPATGVSSPTPGASPSRPSPSATVAPSPSIATWSSVDEMQGRRKSGTATLLPDGDVLVAGGGGNGGQESMHAETYDPTTRTWAGTATMGVPHDGHTATALNDGRVLIAGGGVANSELFDPITRTWTPTGNLAGSRTTHTATLLRDGRVLVTGGIGLTGAPLATAELFDPTSGLWTSTGGMAGARAGHTATLLPDGRVLVAGGRNSSDGAGPLATVESYDPETGSWTPMSSMAIARERHTATMLPDGDVLIVGGLSSGELEGGAPLTSSELYDPTADTWTTAQDMGHPRADHTATLLQDGTVLVVGGGNDDHDAAITTERYDPANDAWSASGDLRDVRSDHDAVLLGDGTVLVLGGRYGVSSIIPLATAELFDPRALP